MFTATVLLPADRRAFELIGYGQHRNAWSHRNLETIRCGYEAVLPVPHALVARGHDAEAAAGGAPQGLVYIVGGSSYGADVTPDEAERYLRTVGRNLGLGAWFWAGHFGRHGRFDFHVLGVNATGDGRVRFGSRGEAAREVRTVFRAETERYNRKERATGPNPRPSIANLDAKGRVYYWGDEQQEALADPARDAEVVTLSPLQRLELLDEVMPLVVPNPPVITPVLRVLLQGQGWHGTLPGQAKEERRLNLDAFAAAPKAWPPLASELMLARHSRAQVMTLLTQASREGSDLMAALATWERERPAKVDAAVAPVGAELASVAVDVPPPRLAAELPPAELTVAGPPAPVPVVAMPPPRIERETGPTPEPATPVAPPPAPVVRGPEVESSVDAAKRKADEEAKAKKEAEDKAAEEKRRQAEDMRRQQEAQRLREAAERERREAEEKRKEEARRNAGPVPAFQTSSLCKVPPVEPTKQPPAEAGAATAAELTAQRGRDEAATRAGQKQPMAPTPVAEMPPPRFERVAAPTPVPTAPTTPPAAPSPASVERAPAAESSGDAAKRRAEEEAKAKKAAEEKAAEEKRKEDARRKAVPAPAHPIMSIFKVAPVAPTPQGPPTRVGAASTPEPIAQRGRDEVTMRAGQQQTRRQETPAPAKAVVIAPPPVNPPPVAQPNPEHQALWTLISRYGNAVTLWITRGTPLDVGIIAALERCQVPPETLQEVDEGGNLRVFGWVKEQIGRGALRIDRDAVLNNETICAHTLNQRNRQVREFTGVWAKSLAVLEVRIGTLRGELARGAPAWNDVMAKFEALSLVQGDPQLGNRATALHLPPGFLEWRVPAEKESQVPKGPYALHRELRRFASPSTQTIVSEVGLRAEELSAHGKLLAEELERGRDRARGRDDR